MRVDAPGLRRRHAPETEINMAQRFADLSVQTRSLAANRSCMSLTMPPLRLCGIAQNVFVLRSATRVTQRFKSYERWHAYLRSRIQAPSLLVLLEAQACEAFPARLIDVRLIS